MAGGIAASTGPGSFPKASRRASGCTRPGIRPGNASSTRPGNLKAVQKLLGHESIQTRGDIYTDWDAEQLAESLARGGAR
jgi:integrase